MITTNHSIPELKHLLLGFIEKPHDAGIVQLPHLEATAFHAWLRSLRGQWREQGRATRLVLIADKHLDVQPRALDIIHKAARMTGFDLVGLIGPCAEHWARMIDVPVISQKPDMTPLADAIRQRNQVMAQLLGNSQAIEELADQLDGANVPQTQAGQIALAVLENKVSGDEMFTWVGVKAEHYAPIDIQSSGNDDGIEQSEEDSPHQKKEEYSGNQEHSDNVAPVEEFDETGSDPDVGQSQDQDGQLDLTDAEELTQKTDQGNELIDEEQQKTEGEGETPLHLPREDILQDDLESTEDQEESVVEEKSYDKADDEAPVACEQASPQIAEQKNDPRHEVHAELAEQTSGLDNLVDNSQAQQDCGQDEDDCPTDQNLFASVEFDPVQAQEVIANLRQQSGFVPSWHKQTRAGANTSENTRQDKDAPELEVIAKSKTPDAHHLVAPKRISGIVRTGTVIEHDGDIIIEGTVHDGAEIRAGGDIHIYGLAGGRLFAGCNGNTAACLYINRFDAEIVSIDGRGRVFEDIPNNWRRASMKISLDPKSRVLRFSGLAKQKSNLPKPSLEG